MRWLAGPGVVGALARARQDTLPDDAVGGILRPWHRHNGVRRRAATGGAWVVTLISFDIDGTLDVGDPPGLIPMDLVRQAKQLGCLIGSCSDRLLSDQRRLWAHHHVSVDFTVLKHRLAEVKARFQADVYYHVGDTDMDHFYAQQAGFRFVKADASGRQLLGSAVLIEVPEP